MVVDGKEYVLTNKKRFYCVITAVILLISLFYFSITAGGHADTNPLYIDYNVSKGETLWEIAGKYNKNTDIRRYIRKIMDLNDMDKGYIYEGQTILIPLDE